jgi:hypothetical protein
MPWDDTEEKAFGLWASGVEARPTGKRLNAAEVVSVQVVASFAVRLSSFELCRCAFAISSCMYTMICKPSAGHLTAQSMQAVPFHVTLQMLHVGVTNPPTTFADQAASSTP